MHAQARVQSVEEVLCGWFVIPGSMEQPLEVVINPLGTRLRSERRLWNDGQQRLKLVPSSVRPQVFLTCITAVHDTLRLVACGT